ncbi:MAG TPA: peptidylprolyl isomerase [Longimicrobiales bacterium]|nr:peptidylprolyl isomerase [Longimicrobiales bacterium]
MLLLALGLVGCGEPPVLEVGPVGYSQADLSLMNDEQRGLLVDLTAFGLAVAEERQDSLAAPFVRREVRSLALQRLAVETAVQEAGMDEDVLRSAYQRDPVPELVVRHLVVLSERWRPEEHRDSARALAEEALRKARAGEPFAELAGEYSDEPGAAERGGLLEPGRQGTWAREFWEAALRLDVGEVSPVVETEFGFHVLRLEERRAVPFEEVREEVLDRFVDLPSALDRVAEQGQGQGADPAISVDTAALRTWLAGDTVTGPLAEWSDPEGSLRVEVFEEYVATLTADQRAAVLADWREAVSRTTVLANEVRLSERAARFGYNPSAAAIRAVEDRWTQRIQRWAESLGFAAGAGPERVRDQALEALGAGRQSAAIARKEIRGISGVLGDLYPVTDRTAESVAQ